MKLILTIDTEEDNWGDYRPTGHTVRNIDRIPELQRICDAFVVRPTYLVSYPVVEDDRAVSILRGILDRGGCEIGTHCHPWNTPPFEGESNAWNSMLCNLPPSLQYRKIQTLHDLILRRFGVTASSFRSGRWGYGPEVARVLHALGYKVDSSITPYYSWADSGGPDFSDIGPSPYLFSADFPYEAANPGAEGLIEIPATVGYLQDNFERSNRILKTLTRNPIKRFSLWAVLSKLGFVNRLCLCPELCDGPEMIKLARRMMKKGFPVLNVFFHSPTLQAGLSPYTKTPADEHNFLNRLIMLLRFARDAGIESLTLSEVAKLIRADFDLSSFESTSRS